MLFLSYAATVACLASLVLPSILQLVAQSNTFILAGYETTANTLSFCVYNIARDPNIQSRLLQEVDAFGRDKRVTYQDLDKVRTRLRGHSRYSASTCQC